MHILQTSWDDNYILFPMYMFNVENPLQSISIILLHLRHTQDLRYTQYKHNQKYIFYYKY